MPDPPANLDAQLQAEIAAAEPLVAEVRRLFNDLDREMQRRYTFEVALRATPAFRALLRELVDDAAARPEGGVSKTDALAADSQQAA